MPSRTKPNRKGGPHLQRMRGHVIGGLDMSSIMDFVKKAVAELKRGKYVSKIGKAYASTGLPGAPIAGTIGNLAEQAGFGRKRRVGRPRKTTAKHPKVKRPVGRPKKARGGALSLAQRRGLVPKPPGYIEGSGKKLAQRKVVKPSGPLFGKGLRNAGNGLTLSGNGLRTAGNGLRIAGTGRVSKRTVFP